MKNSKDEVTLTFTGDIMCLPQQISSVEKSCGTRSYGDMFSQVSSLWRDSDYVVGNLETPVAGPEMRYASASMSFNAPDAFLEAVRASGVDFVSLANNHCMDRGINGLERTIRKVKSSGLDFTGAYLTEKDSDRVFVKEIKGIRFAFISCTYAFNRSLESVQRLRDEQWRVDVLTALSFDGAPIPGAIRRFLSKAEPRFSKAIRRALREEYSGGRKACYQADAIYPRRIGKEVDRQYEERIRDKIIQAKKTADFVICLPHIGGQYNPAPGEYQKYTMKWMSDCGADLVIANHAHTPLRCERFSNGVLGAYALGNFCFTPGVGFYEPEHLAEYSVLLNVTVDRMEGRVCYKRANFSVLKSVPDGHGGAIVNPIPKLYSQTQNLFEREKLVLENEAVVNRFSGGSLSVGINDSYVYPLAKE